MELLIACFLIGWLVVEAPAAIADAYVARKAAKAGEWDFINGHEARKDERAAARAARQQAWAERIFNRDKAKADGGPKRPGLGTLAGDVYHGMCEDALTKRAARRDARAPFDPTAPTLRQRALSQLKRRVARHRNQDGTPEPQPVPLVDRWCGDRVAHHRHEWWLPGSGRFRCAGTQPAADTDTDNTPDPDTDKPVDDSDFDWSWAAEPAQPTPQPAGGTDMTAPTATTAAPTIADVQTNEAARGGFKEMHAAAAQLAESARLAEEARRRIAAVATAAADGMAGVRFDRGATDAVSNINDTVHDSTLAKWSEVADQISGAAKAGLQSLEKYVDAEDTVASNNIDARTLEPTAS